MLFTNPDGHVKRIPVSAAGFRAGNLHHYWHTEFVDQLETDRQCFASDLIGHISRDQMRAWQTGTPSDWAKEAFKVAKEDAYGQLPEPSTRPATACPTSRSRPLLRTWPRN